MAETVGRYTVCGSMGSGGQGLIQYGRLTGPAGFSRMVALKRVRPDLNSAAARAMLLDEARLASRVVHPNVVQTLDVVWHDDELVLVLELVMGQSLVSLTREKTMMPWSIAAAVASGALRGVHAAHQAVDTDGSALALVHRDLSPHNIIVDIHGVPKVLDFGIAKAVGRAQQNTDQGILKGRLAYMAPEYIHGTNNDRRSDIWAMGVVLWECLSGKRLFASTAGTVMGAVLTQPVPSLLDKGVPPGLDDIVQRALQRDLSQRFQSASDMADALDSLGPAPPAEVGRWVAATAETTLTTMQNRLREIEAGNPPIAAPLDPATTPGGVPAWEMAGPPKSKKPQTASGSRPKARPWPWLMWSLPVVTLAIGLLTGHLLTPASRPLAAPPQGASRLTDPSFEDGGLMTAETEPIVEEVGVKPSLVAVGTADAPVPSETQASDKTTAPAKPRMPKPSCKPPYVEVDGVKRWKRHCF